MSGRSIEEVMAAHTDELLAISGVVGLGQALCGTEPCIRVYVIELTQQIEQAVPDELEGYQIELVETGEIKAR